MGTLRAGGKKPQIRKEQSRWKMRTAPACTERGAAAGASSVKRGSVESVSGDVATACRSVPEDGRGAAGVTGARLLPAGRAQQAGVSQSAHREPGRQQALERVSDPWRPVA